MSGIVIYGAGGHARELLFQLQIERGASSVVAMVDDIDAGGTIHGVRVLDYDQAAAQYSGCEWLVAVGNISVRAALLSKIRRDGMIDGSFVSSRAVIAPTAKVATPAQLFAGTIISDNCELCENVIVNFNCVISHDVKIGAHSTLAPGASIAGHVVVGREVWVGVGATITNGTAMNPVRIGDRVTIGAGACVIGDVPPHTTVIGVPARPVERGAPCG
jgi:sugar O-acyltransferase (sialic acid O-acetyltransferase NeuD family)